MVAKHLLHDNEATLLGMFIRFLSNLFLLVGEPRMDVACNLYTKQKQVICSLLKH